MGISAGTIGASAVGLQAAGGVASAMGAYSNARTQKAQLEAQAQAATSNAAVAATQARMALEMGEQQEAGQRMKTAALFSDQRAAMGANGVDMGSGSPSEILASTKFMGERDALTIRDNAIRQAWGYKVGANNALTQAASARAMAGSINPMVAAGSSLLTGAGNVAGSWYKMKREGVF